MVGRAQIAMEFLILVGFLFLIALIVFVVGGVYLVNFQEKENREALIDFAQSIRRELELAAVVQEGYSRQVDIPHRIDSRLNYSMSHSGQNIIFETPYDSVIILVPNATGNLTKGINTISKENGVIVING